MMLKYSEQEQRLQHEQEQARVAAERQQRAAAAAQIEASRQAELAQMGGRKGCNCSKTKCLKLYCECFAASDYCRSLCKCNNCHNLPQHDALRKRSADQIMSRNPTAFDAKEGASTHTKGCKCRKSQCLKKYCECFAMGFACAELCECGDCHNQVYT